MRPQLAGLAREHGDKVVVLKVNVDRQRALASKAGVRSIPDRRLFFAGRQLDRSVGGLSQTALERMVLKHEGVMASSPQEDEGGSMLAIKMPLQKLKRQLADVRSDNRLQLMEGTVAEQAPPAQAEEGAPSESKDGLKSGTIEPMAKDWLPPGVTAVE
jgi:thioredoxin-like negative regulator of GroEL